MVVTTSTIDESRNTTVDTVEDEDDLLYGEAAPSLFTEAAAALTEPVKVEKSNFVEIFFCKSFSIIGQVVKL